MTLPPGLLSSILYSLYHIPYNLYLNKAGGPQIWCGAKDFWCGANSR